MVRKPHWPEHFPRKIGFEAAQAADLTICRACSFSNDMGLR
jgi:hypothetical protein